MKVLSLFFVVLFTGLACGIPGSSRDALDEDFGYVTIRDGAHMFWVTYHVDQPGVWTDFPLILWLQGGPGTSSVGYGNFQEVGPYFTNQSIRETAWTTKANLMFVDSPVGTGYSYLDSPLLGDFCETNAQVADDMVVLLKSVFTDYPDMQVMPFYIFGESYGGKMAVDIALALNTAITNGEIVSDFRGIGLGDAWISPVDYVTTWGPYLYNMGLVNSAGQRSIDTSAGLVQDAVTLEEWRDAYDEYVNTQTVTVNSANGVDFDNVLAKDDPIYAAMAMKKQIHSNAMSLSSRERYENYIRASDSSQSVNDLMNGVYKERWQIPDDVIWGEQTFNVYNSLINDFMKPVVDSVQQLLDETDIYVAVYNGNLDLVNDVVGTYRWIENMEFNSKAEWEATSRENFYVPGYTNKAGSVQNFQNFGVFTILRAGHVVTVDAPIEALAMIDLIFEYEAANNAQQTGEDLK